MKINPKVQIFLTVFICALVATIMLDQIFKAMGLTIEGMPKFKYKGKTPKSDWYNYMEPYAKAAGTQFGIPWQAILVQTAIETGWGKSSLFAKYNNFGGVKFAGSGAPAKVNMKTGEVFNGQSTTINADFAAWSTPWEGLKGYCNFFHRNKRYAAALKFSTDPYNFITEIRKAGYATDPNYVAKLHTMLKNDLKA